MIDYKRFTERVGKAVAVKESSTNDNKSIWNAIERLAELEDKIERGELFSIPFIYHNRKLNAYTVLYEDDYCEYLMGQVFVGENAKEEAKKFLEQKIKELKGEA